ncbi:MAG: HlyD family efflux transporter periplasmic adaptor subunit [Candidatus Altimarinota bacterium]
MMFLRFFQSWKVFVPLLAFLLIGSGVVFLSGDEASEGASEEVYKTVDLIRADSLVQVPVVSTTLGTVQSDHEVEIRAETSGRIVSIGVKKGDILQPDQILLELDHQILDAQILQAEARLASAQAQLAKLKNGERPEDIAILEQKILAEGERLKEMKRGARPEELAIVQTQLENAQRNLSDVELELKNIEDKAARDLATTLQKNRDVIQLSSVTMAKILSSNLQDVIYPIRTPENRTCRLQFNTILDNRIADACFEALFASEAVKDFLIDLAQDDQNELFEKLNTTDEKITLMRNFLVKLLQVVNSTVSIDQGLPLDESLLNSYKSAIASGQTELESVAAQVNLQIQNSQSQLVNNKSAVDAAQNRVNQSNNAVLNLEKELALKSSGATPEQIIIQETQIRQLELQLEIARNGARNEDVLAQEAQVKQAQADVAVAVANKNKAVLRSPLRGTVILLPFEVGDYVNNGETLAVVANREALQVKTYITEKERGLIMVDGLVTAQEGKIKGFVEEISPALEQETKKIEVLVRLTEATESLVLGQTLFVNFESSLPENTLRVPLSAVRIVGESAFVLTVDADGFVQSLPVTAGTLLEDTVIITGVAQDQLIVADVLGIKEGEKVHSSSSLGAVSGFFSLSTFDSPMLSGRPSFCQVWCRFT